jgi:hypothetical protein
MIPRLQSIIGLFISLYGIIKSLFSYYKMRKSNILGKTKKYHEIYDTIWESIKNEDGIKHMYVALFHNGSYYFMGEPIFRFTVTIDATKDDDENPLNHVHIKERMVDEFPYIFNVLSVSGTYHMDKDTPMFVEKKYKSMFNGKYFSLFLLKMDKSPVGFMGVHYDNPDFMDDKREKYYNLLSDKIYLLLKEDK